MGRICNKDREKRNEEDRNKYRALRESRQSVEFARKARNWPWKKVAMYANLQSLIRYGPERIWREKQSIQVAETAAKMLIRNAIGEAIERKIVSLYTKSLRRGENGETGKPE